MTGVQTCALRSSGGEAKDSYHLLFYPPRSARREPSLRLNGTHDLAEHPNMVQNSNRRRFRFVQSLAVAFVNRKMSSAKKRCDRWTPVLKWRG